MTGDDRTQGRTKWGGGGALTWVLRRKASALPETLPGVRGIRA